MTQSEENQHSDSGSTQSSQEGSPNGEGRGRRRRRRPNRRPDGSPEAGERSEPKSEQAPQAPSTQSPEAGGERSDSDAERKRKRRRKKKPSEGAGQPPADNGEETRPTVAELPRIQQQPQQQQQTPQRGRERAPRREQPEKKERAPRGSILQRRSTRGEYQDPAVKEEAPSAPVPVNAINIDGYISHHKGWQREVLTTLRAIIREAASDIEESILWSQPVFNSNGPVCYLKAFTDHVNFGFWRGTELDDPDGLLTGDLTKMRHVTLTSSSDIKREKFEQWVRLAVKLNRDKGDPTLA